MVEATQRATGLTPGKARALLGRFLFSGEDAEKPLDGLSGGERRRLSLAVLVHSGANVLILDEPTNHLDLESREALEAALSQFPGSLLLVSHDRALLDAVGTRTIALEDRALHSYVGGWPEYVRVREERAKADPGPASRSGARQRRPARAAAKLHGWTGRRDGRQRAAKAQRRRPQARGRQRGEAARGPDRGPDRGRRGRPAGPSRTSSPTPSAWATPEASARSIGAPRGGTTRPSAELYERWETVSGLTRRSRAAGARGCDGAGRSRSRRRRTARGVENRGAVRGAGLDSRTCQASASPSSTTTAG